MSEGKKFDEGKPPFDLLPYEALAETAKVLAFGAKKYGRGNWAKGINLSRLCAASLRHTYQFLSGEDDDIESGINHLAHATCGLMFALTLIKQGRTEYDDRWTRDPQWKPATTAPNHRRAASSTCSCSYCTVLRDGIFDGGRSDMDKTQSTEDASTGE